MLLLNSYLFRTKACMDGGKGSEYVKLLYVLPTAGEGVGGGGGANM
jgi:hypothetical protein